jgi:hypothetical protein
MGSFGSVHLALGTDSGMLMAVKKVPILKYLKIHQYGYVDVSMLILSKFTLITIPLLRSLMTETNCNTYLFV